MRLKNSELNVPHAGAAFRSGALYFTSVARVVGVVGGCCRDVDCVALACCNFQVSARAATAIGVGLEDALTRLAADTGGPMFLSSQVCLCVRIFRLCRYPGSLWVEI